MPIYAELKFRNELPFENLSSDPEETYFANGLVKDLITRLSSCRAFPVITRNSGFEHRGGDIDTSAVHRQLADGAFSRVKVAAVHADPPDFISNMNGMRRAE